MAWRGAKLFCSIRFEPYQLFIYFIYSSLTSSSSLWQPHTMEVELSISIHDDGSTILLLSWWFDDDKVISLLLLLLLEGVDAVATKAVLVFVGFFAIKNGDNGCWFQSSNGVVVVAVAEVL